LSDDPNTTVESARQHIREALRQFVTDPSDTDFQQGFLEALYVIGREGLGMDLGDDSAAQWLQPKPPVAHLKLVT